MIAESDALAFAKVAQSLRAAKSPLATAEEIVGYTRQQLDADHAGLTLLRARYRLETVTATDPMVERADRLQEDLSEGPARDSSWRHGTLTSSDLQADPRWPRWATEVVALGVTSILACELTNQEDRRIGAITLYWSQRRVFTADDIAFTNIFARHAALALTHSMDEAGLNVALDGRKLIGQAQGILMATYDLDQDRAFEVLSRFSQARNIKLRDIAQDIVELRKPPKPQRVGNCPMGTAGTG
jgi:GAF domain-containing protein